MPYEYYATVVGVRDGDTITFDVDQGFNDVMVATGHAVYRKY